MVTVEELTKIDILCDSTERNTFGSNNPNLNVDNINQNAFTIGNMTNSL